MHCRFSTSGMYPDIQTFFPGISFCTYFGYCCADICRTVKLTLILIRGLLYVFGAVTKLELVSSEQPLLQDSLAFSSF